MTRPRKITIGLALNDAEALAEILRGTVEVVPTEINTTADELERRITQQRTFEALDLAGHEVERDVGMSHDYGWRCRKIGCGWDLWQGSTDLTDAEAAHAEYVAGKEKQ